MHKKITPRRKIKWFSILETKYQHQQKPVQHFIMWCLLKKNPLQKKIIRLKRNLRKTSLLDKSQNLKGLYKVNIVNKQETFVTYLTKRNKHQRLVVLLILKLWLVLTRIKTLYHGASEDHSWNLHFPLTIF